MRNATKYYKPDAFTEVSSLSVVCIVVGTVGDGEGRMVGSYVGGLDGLLVGAAVGLFVGESLG